MGDDQERNEHVTEMPERNEELPNSVETSARTGKPVATEQKEQKMSLPSSSRTMMSFKLRKWMDIHPEGTFDEQAFNVFKEMTKVLRHGDLPREEDGGVVS